MARTLETGRRPVALIEREAATPWTDDRLAELRRLWVEESLSSSEIAQRMGISRGTVMGKINRLGLLRRGAPSPPVLHEPAGSQDPPPPPATPFITNTEVVENHASSRAGNHPTIFELRAGQCRFPLGGVREPAVFFCGKPADLPKPYCRECCQRAYTTMKPRT
jgi:GcrA cell cycle regulator